MDKETGFVINMPDFSSLQLDYPKINRIMQEYNQSSMESINANVEEREKNEREKRDSLRKIAENSEDTVKSLKETNELLRENNQLLEEKNEQLSEKLNNVNQILSGLFAWEQQQGDEQKELMQQSVDLANQIDMSIAKNGKFDWKGLFANTSLSSAMMAIQVFLHSKGLI